MNDKDKPGSLRPAESREMRTRLDPRSLHEYLERQAIWSGITFGSGLRTKGIIDHIRKELIEITADPGDLEEWIDVIILALDGYWRHGGQPLDLMRRLQEKQNKNFKREWPKPLSEDVATEHIREAPATDPPASHSSPQDGATPKEPDAKS